MKKTMLMAILVILFSFNNSHAEGKATYYDVCKELSGLAGTVMDARQTGVPITSIMDIVKEEFANSPRLGKVSAIVYFAYQKPQYSSESYIRKAKTEYINEVFSACISAEKKW